MCSVSQLCLTLCDPMVCRPPGSSVHGILQARTLEGVVISFAKRSSQPRDWNCISCVSCTEGGLFTAEPLGKPIKQLCAVLRCFSLVQFFMALWIIARQTPLSMRFPRQEYWSCHFLLQGIFLIQWPNLHLLHYKWILCCWVIREAHKAITLQFKKS